VATEGGFANAVRLATLALALLAFLVASEVGGNPFVSAFVGSLAMWWFYFHKLSRVLRSKN